MLKINGMPTFIVVAYNDMKLLPNMYESFLKTVPTGRPYGMVGVDVGSTDGSREFLKSKMPTLNPGNMQLNKGLIEDDDFPHLSRCLNAGIEMALRNMATTHICWLHVDADYHNNGKGMGWIESLLQYMKEHPDAGKVAPETEQGLGRGERPGNMCPWIMSKRAILDLKKEYNEVFPNNYLYMHLEDWATNARLIGLGYKVMIAPTAIISHIGMDSRKNSPNNLQINWAYGYNSQFYNKEFNTYKPIETAEQYELYTGKKPRKLV